MISIVTIGRQHGTGGERIGRELADRLGFAYYDKESLREYVLENGWEKTLQETYGERHASSLLLSLSTGAYSFGYYDPEHSGAISQKPYQIAFEAIKEVSRRGPCVIVGRCADYVLRGRTDCLNLFFHAPLDYRAAALAERENIDLEEASRRAQAQDHLRRSYYNYYTGKQWGAVDSYQLTIDTSIGPEQATAFLEGILQRSVAGQTAEKGWSRR